MEMQMQERWGAGNGWNVQGQWNVWGGWNGRSRYRFRIGRQTGNEGIGFAVSVSVLAVIITCLLAGIVMSRTDVSARELEGYYQEKEQELVGNAREFFDRMGFPDSGVMLTRVVDTDGSRQYTLSVHHGRIDRMCEEDRQALMEEFEKFVFEDADSVFFHKFYVNQ